MYHFVIIFGLFFIFGRAFVLLLLVYYIVYLYIYKKERSRYINNMIAVSILLGIVSMASPQFAIGESAPLLQVFTASYNYALHGSSACSVIYSHGNSVGYDMFCNQVPATTQFIAKTMQPQQTLYWARLTTTRQKRLQTS